MVGILVAFSWHFASMDWLIVRSKGSHLFSGSYAAKSVFEAVRDGKIFVDLG